MRKGKTLIAISAILGLCLMIGQGQAAAADGDAYFDNGQLNAQALQEALSTDQSASMQLLKEVMQAGMDSLYVNIPDLGQLPEASQDLGADIMEVVIAFAQANDLNVRQWTQKAAQNISDAAWETSSDMTGVDQDSIMQSVGAGIEEGAARSGQDQLRRAAVQGVENSQDIFDRAETEADEGFPRDTENAERALELRQETASPAQ
jgi:hypothetical protein